MNEENGETLHQEESWAAISKEILIPKPNDSVNSKSKNFENPKIENISLEIKDNFDENDCIWGIKQSGNKYKSVTIKNELYALNDCVCCRSGLQLDYIGKIMKLFQENDQKVCTLRWFFRPFELPTSLKEIYKATNTRELFLAFGKGIGVENKNPLGVITRKCKVLCIAKDDFNDRPSNEHLDMCDFFFGKAFNCDTLQIIGLDGVVDAIGAQKVYNKKEWLNWTKNETSSPLKTFCESFGLHTLPTNSNEKNVLPLGHHNSSSTITDQSIKKTLIKKRKRESVEKIIPSPKMMEKIKKIKLSSPLKNPKLSVIMNLTKHEDEDHKLESEVKNNVTIIDAPNIGILSSESTLSFIGFNPNIYKSLGIGKTEECLEKYIDLSSNTPMILEQSIERIGNNADDIHVTCEGFPIESFVEPLEKSESSTRKLKKNKNSPQHIVEEHGTNKIGEPQNSRKSEVKNKTTFGKEQKITPKVVQKKKRKKTSNFIIGTTEEKHTEINFVECNDSKRPQNKEKMVVNGKIEDQILDTLHCNKFEKNCEDVVKKHEVDCVKGQQPLGSPLATLRPIIIDENLPKKEYIGTLQSIEDVKSSTKLNIAIPLKLDFEFECEDWIDEIQMAITTKRILLLHNIDPKLHSSELEETLSKFLDTKCQVRKIMTNSFNYTTTSALLKFSTQDIAQKSLQNLCKDCLVVCERTLIATLYEDLQFANKLHCFHGHICIQPRSEMLEKNHIEMDLLPHVAQGNTIEFTYGLQWRLLQEQHELQWQLLNEFHEKELNLLSKERKINKRLRKSK